MTRKGKGVTAVEVEAEHDDNKKWKKDLLDHDLALHLLGYKMINVGSVEGEQDSNDISETVDFDRDNVNGFVLSELPV